MHVVPGDRLKRMPESRAVFQEYGVSMGLFFLGAQQPGLSQPQPRIRNVCLLGMREEWRRTEGVLERGHGCS